MAAAGLIVAVCIVSSSALAQGNDYKALTLDQATAVSVDGSTVVGYGTHNGVREGLERATRAASTGSRRLIARLR